MLPVLPAISAQTVTQFGLYILLPIFIAALVFVMFDISKKSNAGRSGTFWIFLALGAGFAGFILKVIMEVVFERYIF